MSGHRTHQGGATTMVSSRRFTDEPLPAQQPEVLHLVTTKLTDLDPDSEHTDTDDETPAASRPNRRVLPSFGLSATQLLGTALAAITATVAASYLGVTGTVIGAALASVLSAVGNAVYTTSLRTTSNRVREVVPLPARVTRTLPVVDDPPPALPASRPRPRRPRPHPTGAVVWKRAAVGSLGLFVVLMAVVTGVEAVAGRPVSDLLRGNSGGGTTFFGHNTVTTKTVPATPTVYVTVTPKVVVTTPTVTQTAPATTTTPPTSAGVSDSATPSDTGTPTSPSATDTSSTP